jgi:uncharacterized protein (DUF58 family)
VFLLFALAVGVAAINTGNNLFYMILAMMLSLILVSGLVSEHCLRRLHFHRHMASVVFVNESTTVTVVVRKDKGRVPSFSLRLLEVMDGEKVDHGLVLHQLDPGATQILSYALIPSKRGRLNLEGLCVVTSFPFGLFAKSAYYPLNDMAVACPQITALDDRLVQGVTARGNEQDVHRRGSGNQLYNMRLYQSGDDSRDIHWISTAKTSRLIVRETQAEEQRRATIHLDVVAPSTHDAVFEQAVSFTASLVAHLFRQGYHLRLVVGSSAIVSAEADLVALFHTLALCQRQDPGIMVPETGEHLPLTEPGDEAGLLLCVRPWDAPGFWTIPRSGVVFTPELFAKETYVAR